MVVIFNMVVFTFLVIYLFTSRHLPDGMIASLNMTHLVIILQFQRIQIRNFNLNVRMNMSEIKTACRNISSCTGKRYRLRVSLGYF